MPTLSKDWKIETSGRLKIETTMGRWVNKAGWAQPYKDKVTKFDVKTSPPRPFSAVEWLHGQKEI